MPAPRPRSWAGVVDAVRRGCPPRACSRRVEQQQEDYEGSALRASRYKSGRYVARRLQFFNLGVWLRRNYRIDVIVASADSFDFHIFLHVGLRTAWNSLYSQRLRLAKGFKNPSEATPCRFESGSGQVQKFTEDRGQLWLLTLENTSSSSRRIGVATGWSLPPRARAVSDARDFQSLE